MVFIITTIVIISIVFALITIIIIAASITMITLIIMIMINNTVILTTVIVIITSMIIITSALSTEQLMSGNSPTHYRCSVTNVHHRERQSNTNDAPLGNTALGRLTSDFSTLFLNSTYHVPINC